MYQRVRSAVISNSQSRDFQGKVAEYDARECLVRAIIIRQSQQLKSYASRFHFMQL